MVNEFIGKGKMKISYQVGMDGVKHMLHTAALCLDFVNCFPGILAYFHYPYVY
jgi:hypothetical protein